MQRSLASAQLLIAAAITIWLGCNKSQQKSSGDGNPPPTLASTRSSVAPQPMAAVGSGAQSTSKELEEPTEQAPEPAPKPGDASSKKGRKAHTRVGGHPLILDGLIDVAPAGPSAATAAGVVLVTRSGRPLLAPLLSKPSSSFGSIATPVSPLEVEAGQLVALERGPAISGGYAYFIHEGHLVRSQLPNGALENLADDARSYTRVSVPDPPLRNAPRVAAYIARHPADPSTLVARLWIEGQGSTTLTPDGSTGNSVALARTEDGYAAVSLESRSGMSPVHARTVTFEAGKPKFGNDVIPWVAGTAQPLTEIHAVSEPSGIWALLPIERDATRFGLARIDLGLVPAMGAEVHWRDYPNGVEPAVLAAGYLCNRPVVLYARPATAEPHATQELHLASIGLDGLGASTVVATSRAFSDASTAALDGGALLVYVADRRTWTRRLRCAP